MGVEITDSSRKIMGIVVVDSKGRISLPSSVRKSVGIKTGERLLVLVKDGAVTLVPADLFNNYPG